MSLLKAPPVAERRRFLKLVAASVPLLGGASACNDETIRTVSGPSEPPPPEAESYAELLELYFGADGLGDADFIGGYHAQVEGLSGSEAFDYTSGARELVDAADSLEAAVSDLEDRLLDDFMAARVVDVAGWTLARTEVELCILWWLE